MEKPQKICHQPLPCTPLSSCLGSYPLPHPIFYVDVVLSSFSSFSTVAKRIQLTHRKRTKCKQSSKQQ